MAASLVNLDALILREDFEATTDEPGQPNLLTATMKISDLGAENIVYSVLRKPDFQRETANWTPRKVAELVRSFLDGDLIPSVILWRSPSSGNIFVIDGAHRLSALIAWVQDDYGDSHNSLRFFDNVIPDEQKRAAEETRKLIGEMVGSYAQLSTALKNVDTAAKEMLRRARNMSAFAIHLQWVIGEAEKAETSFFRINQQATPIDQTELDMIRARKKPNALATRAFVRAGTGHKYWSGFDTKRQIEVERIAKEVYELFFRPTLESPIKTTDLPVAGRGYSADSIHMLFELVNFVNNVHPEAWQEVDSTQGKRSKSPDTPRLQDDTTGEVTLTFMKAVREIAVRVSGNSPGSLGLNPAVYFYSATGRFQPAAFLATVEFISSLIEHRRLDQFTKVRAGFEDFLVEYKYFLNQITQRYGSVTRSVPHIVSMYTIVMSGKVSGSGDAKIVAALKAQPALTNTIRESTDEDRQFGRNFTRETKNSIYLRSALETIGRCGICGARLHLKSTTVDHKIRKEDGGAGSPENGQLTHPYCNSGYKESGRSR
ncbi:HNH endonuclease family protein [Amycolatopsis sp. MEPSY49]|uniref:HNH endonuclease family protein n=1 Tax=Amycolatopsis sp. MEPSY49 TaxID=3151600 RepID=UPI003EF480E6